MHDDCYINLSGLKLDIELIIGTKIAIQKGKSISLFSIASMIKRSNRIELKNKILEIENLITKYL